MDQKVAAIRSQLPAVQSCVYLNTGTCGPMPEVVRTEMVRPLEQQLTAGRIAANYFPDLGRLAGHTRLALADMLGCDAQEIAITHNTTDGMNLVTLGINWRPGDEGITADLEHPGALFPLYAARERFGITVKVAELLNRPEEAPAIIEQMITSRTRLISLSHVSYITGAVLPIREIAEVAHRHGVLLLVDGAQSFGAMPVNVRDLGCDFYAVPGQKWLCGPEGTGALYAAQGAVSQVQVTFAAYNTVDAFSIHGGILPKGNAQKFEQGTLQPALLTGQLAACRWLTEEVGLAWAFGRIGDLARFAHERLGAIPGVQVVTPRECAGLITFQVSGMPAGDLVTRLAGQSIVARTVPHPQSVRIATGFYNTEAEIEQLAAAVEAALAG